MSEEILATLLSGNDTHVNSLPDGHFDGVQTGQEPAVVSVCCSDSRVPQAGMWDVDTPGWLFTPSTIGNQAWDVHDGNRVLDGSVAYPLVAAGTSVAIVVGHTGCGAVAAALAAVQRETTGSYPSGVQKWIDLLIPVVEEGLTDSRLDLEGQVSVGDQLVEYNVDRQVNFLKTSDSLPDSITVYGFVYDFQEVYGESPGRAYLVNKDGETDPAAIRSALKPAYQNHVKRILK